MSSARSAFDAGHVRLFEPRDLDAAVAVWTEAATGSQPAVFPLADVVSALGADHVALVAERDGALTGAVVAHLHQDHARILRLGVLPHAQGEGVSAALLGALVDGLAARGVRRVSMLLPDGEAGAEAIHCLDPAFIRPGRFDYLLPVGPPDEAARAAIWRNYVAQITDVDIDIDRLVEATRLFTPADIDLAARKAAQAAFESDPFGDGSTECSLGPGSVRATVDDFLTAIADTRPTLTRAMVHEFETDIETYARM